MLNLPFLQFMFFDFLSCGILGFILNTIIFIHLLPPELRLHLNLPPHKKLMTEVEQMLLQY